MQNDLSNELEEKQKQARELALKDVKMYQANDWVLTEETPNYFLLTRNEGSTGVHLLLAIVFWWLLFVPNLVYYFMSKKTKKILK